MKKLLPVLLLAICAASGAKAQSTVRVKLTDGTRTWYEPLSVPHRTADKAFWGMTILSQGATLADDFNTLYALRLSGAREANPILHGKAALFGVTEAVFTASEAYMWWAKRQDDALKAANIPGHKYMKWWVVPIFNIAPHALGVGITLGSTGR